jgi:hypothetical protein
MASYHLFSVCKAYRWGHLTVKLSTELGMARHFLYSSLEISGQPHIAVTFAA